MFQGLGWIKDEVGLRVNKAIIVRKVGDVDVKREVVFANLKPLYRERILKDHPNYKDDDVVVLRYSVPQYVVVRNYYFGDAQVVYNFSKTKAFYLDLENTAYVRRMTRVQFVDFETGEALPLGGFRLVPPKNPQHLRELWENEAVNNYVQGAKEKLNLMWLVIGGVIGAFAMYMILNLTGAV